MAAAGLQPLQSGKDAEGGMRFAFPPYRLFMKFANNILNVWTAAPGCPF